MIDAGRIIPTNADQALREALTELRAHQAVLQERAALCNDLATQMERFIDEHGERATVEQVWWEFQARCPSGQFTLWQRIAHPGEVADALSGLPEQPYSITTSSFWFAMEIALGISVRVDTEQPDDTEHGPNSHAATAALEAASQRARGTR